MSMNKNLLLSRHPQETKGRRKSKHFQIYWHFPNCLKKKIHFLCFIKPNSFFFFNFKLVSDTWNLKLTSQWAFNSSPFLYTKSRLSKTGGVKICYNSNQEFQKPGTLIKHGPPLGQLKANAKWSDAGTRRMHISKSDWTQCFGPCLNPRLLVHPLKQPFILASSKPDQKMQLLLRAALFNATIAPCRSLKKTKREALLT